MALENSPELLSDALHDIKDMLVGRFTRSREELQDGLKLPFCAERKAEGSVESMFQQDRRPRFQATKMAGAIRLPHNKMAAMAKPVGGQMGVALGLIEASRRPR